MMLKTLFGEVLDVDVDINTILQCDIDTILLNLKIVAYGPETRYKIKCDVCDSTDEYTVSYAFRSKPFSFKGLTRGVNELSYTLPECNRVVKYRLPTYTENKFLLSSGWLEFIKKQVISVDGVEDINNFFDYELSIRDNKSFKKYFDVSAPGFDTRFKLVCPSCKNETETKLEIDHHIFGFTPAHKKLIHGEIFNLCYNANGAFSRDSVYDMPVATRQFYTKNLIDIRSKENDANKSSAQKAPNRPVVKSPTKK